MAEFIECTSLSVSYDITGIATISYTVLSDTPGMKAYDVITVGNKTFQGYITSATYSIIPQSDVGFAGWYQTQVNLIALTTS